MTRPPQKTAAFVPYRKKAVAVRTGRKPKARRGRTAAGPTRMRSRWRERGSSRSHSDRRRNILPALPGMKGQLPEDHRITEEGPAAHIQPSDGGQTRTDSYKEGFDVGYRAGSTVGAEEEMGSLLPPYTVLPEVSAREVMAAGLMQYLPRLKNLLRPDEVYRRLAESLSEKRPLSVVRLGDGELLALAHDTVLPLEQAKAAGPFLPLAGLTLPDYNARSQLAAAVRGADIIGIPSSRLPTYQGLLFPLLRYYGIAYEPLLFTISTINYALHEQGLLQQLLRNRRVLTIGNFARQLGEVLSASSVETIGSITPVNGFADIPRVLAEAAEYPFDIALVASGIPAVVICQRIAGELGKTAIDFGHLANKLVSGELSYN